MLPEIAEAPVRPLHRWRITPGQRLQRHSWDDTEFVLFNDLSGDTHLLDADAIDVLQLLSVAEADTATLAATLQVDADQADALDELLDELVKQYLIEPAC
ncbi:MAG: HPr-rel-A system PqqD family peptide chaperone [Pseudomonadota bacterium]